MAPGQIRTYRLDWDASLNEPLNLDAFARMVESDIRMLLQKEWQKNAELSLYQQEQKWQWDIAVKNSLQFGACRSVADECMKLLDNGTNLLAVKGKTGSGKSTLMSWIAQKMKERHCLVLPIFCGSASLLSNAGDVLKYILYFLEEQLAWPHYFENKENPNAPHAEINRYAVNAVDAFCTTDSSRLLIMVDGLDYLLRDYGREHFWFIPRDEDDKIHLNGKVQMLLSCNEDFPLDHEITALGIEPLSRAETPLVINHILQSISKELPERVRDKIALKPGADNPLYISLLIHRLNMMDRADFQKIAALGKGIAAIEKYQVELIKQCPDDINGICTDIEEVAAGRIGGDFVYSALQYLAVSRQGLRECDLENILTFKGVSWNALDFFLFIQYLNIFFIRRSDGRYDFSYNCIRTGLMEKNEKIQNMHKEILCRFQKMGAEDPVCAFEIPWHCIRADEKEGFINYLKERVASGALGNMMYEPWIYAAKDLYSFSMIDHGAWLLDLLAHGIVLGGDQSLLIFLWFYLKAEFPFIPFTSSMYQTPFLQQKLLEAMLVFARDLYREGETSLKMMGMCLKEAEEFYSYYIGDVLLNGTDRMIDLALENFELHWEAVQREQTPERFRSLGNSYRHLGDRYFRTRDSELREKAVICFNEALKIFQIIASMQGIEKPELIDNLFQLGKSYIKFHIADMQENGLRCFEMYFGEVTSYCLNQDSEDRYIDASDALYHLVFALPAKELDNRRHLERVRKIAQEVLNYQLSMRRLGKLDSCLYHLQASHLWLGDLNAKLGGREDLELALEEYNKALELCENDEERIECNQKKRSVLLKLDGEQNQTSAIITFHEICKLKEDHAREADTEQSYKELADFYVIQTLYPSTEKSVQKFCYERSSKIFEMLYSRTRNESYYRLAVEFYERMISKK